MVLARMRLLRPVWLIRYWRYVLLACFILGGVLSPGSDPVSMLILSGTLLGLYGLSILLTRLAYPKDETPSKLAG
jgi:sec-independent protein translocase protein TatC